MITRSIGKNTLASGSKMNVNMHTYSRSTHNLSYAWRSPMTVGTLVPFLCEVGLAGDTFDIDLRSHILTHPTTGPLYGSYTFRTAVFFCPTRLYCAPLHNNALNIGLDMSKVKLPQLESNGKTAVNNLLRYLGINNFGIKTGTKKGQMDATPTLAYYDIFKNYFANKQEKKFPILSHTEEIKRDLWKTAIFNNQKQQYEIQTPLANKANNVMPLILIKKDFYENAVKKGTSDKINFEYQNFEGTTKKIIYIKNLQQRTADDVEYIDPKNWIAWELNDAIASNTGAKVNWVKDGSNSLSINLYDLDQIDNTREFLLSQGRQQVVINEDNTKIQDYLRHCVRDKAVEQGGLCLTTYNSDIFNNWINSEVIDGDNGINAITAIDTSSGKFTLDSLNLAKKTYELLNRIAISGGSYQDWIETVYTNKAPFRAETPVYEGGYSAEIEFQEVINQTASKENPLGELAGRGVQTNAKGGRMHIKLDENGYLIGVCWITPRVDYCEGNRWHVYLKTMNDYHKPQLDGIGFQDLNTDLMVADTLEIDANGNYRHQSIGKQPAWINYMTNFNRTYGNFAKRDTEANSESFMVLNRWYDKDENGQYDFSTYINPTKYNYVFAESDITTNNFWTQLGVGIEARRVMSAKIMPTI